MSATEDARVITGEAEGLDMSLEAMELAEPLDDAPSAAPADPWLARRMEGFGCSDLPALLVAVGLASAEGAPGYITDRAKLIRRKGGRPVPRLFLEKAGLRGPLKAGEAAQRGQAREHELLDQWRRRLEHGHFYGRHEADLVPSSLGFAADAPKEWYPLIDRGRGRLLDTPDAWIRDVFGALVPVQAKCSMREKRELPWWWAVQLQGELAVQGADRGVLVCGEGWAATWTTIDGPIRSWPVERDERAIAEIRDVVQWGWAEVEKLRRNA